MLSTLLEQEVYLGFPTDTPLQTPSHEHTFYGGSPVFLRVPNKQLLQCNSCLNQTLTFLCQIFCPLDLEQAYNRVLYVLYCEKCQR